MGLPSKSMTVTSYAVLVTPLAFIIAESAGGVTEARSARDSAEAMRQRADELAADRGLVRGGRAQESRQEGPRPHPSVSRAVPPFLGPILRAVHDEAQGFVARGRGYSVRGELIDLGGPSPREKTQHPHARNRSATTTSGLDAGG